MLKQPKKVKVENDQDIVRVVKGTIADHAPRMLERNGEPLAVLLSPEDYAELSREAEIDPWTGYDPARVKETLAQAGGIFAGVDRAQMLRDIYDARGQASKGRPA